MIRGSLLYLPLVATQAFSEWVCVPETPLKLVIGQFAQFMLDRNCQPSEDMGEFHESSDLMEGT